MEQDSFEQALAAVRAKRAARKPPGAATSFEEAVAQIKAKKASQGAAPIGGDPWTDLWKKVGQPDQSSPLESAMALGVGEQPSAAEVARTQPPLPRNVDEWAALFRKQRPDLPQDFIMRQARNAAIESAPMLGAQLTQEQFRKEHPYRAYAHEIASAALGGMGISQDAIINVAQALKNDPRNAYLTGMRGAVSALPFVPNPEPKDKYTAALSSAIQEEHSKQTQGGIDAFLVHALPQAAAGFGGMGASLAMTGGPLKRGGEAIAERLMRDPTTKKSILSALMRGDPVGTTGERAIGSIPGMINMGQYSAMPDIENYKLAEENPSEYGKKIASSFGHGVAIDAVTRTIGGVTQRLADRVAKTKLPEGLGEAEKLDLLKRAARRAKWVARTTPISQAAGMTGVSALQSDRPMDRNTLFRDFALNSLLFSGANAYGRLAPYLPGSRRTQAPGDRRSSDQMRREITQEDIESGQKGFQEGIERITKSPWEDGFIEAENVPEAGFKPIPPMKKAEGKQFQKDWRRSVQVDRKKTADESWIGFVEPGAFTHQDEPPAPKPAPKPARTKRQKVAAEADALLAEQEAQPAKPLKIKKDRNAPGASLDEAQRLFIERRVEKAKAEGKLEELRVSSHGSDKVSQYYAYLLERAGLGKPMGREMGEIVEEPKAPAAAKAVKYSPTRFLDPNNPPRGIPNPYDWVTPEGGRYVWRTMGESEYESLLLGKKTYGGGASKRGNYLAEYPSKASDFGGPGKYLVEFGGARPHGESSKNVLTSSNVTRAWRWEGGKGKDGRWVEEAPEPTQPPKAATPVGEIVEEPEPTAVPEPQKPDRDIAERSAEAEPANVGNRPEVPTSTPAPEPTAPPEPPQPLTGAKALAEHIAGLDKPLASESEWRALFSEYGVDYTDLTKVLNHTLRIKKERARSRAPKGASEIEVRRLEDAQKFSSDRPVAEVRERMEGLSDPISEVEMRAINNEIEQSIAPEDPEMTKLRELREKPASENLKKSFSGIPIDEENMALNAEIQRSNDKNLYSKVARFIRNEVNKTAAQEMLDETLSKMKKLGKYSESLTSPQYQDLLLHAREVYAALVKAAGAERASVALSQVLGAKVAKLAPAPWQREMVGRYVVDQQAQGLLAQGKDPDRNLFLSPTDRALIKKHWDELKPAIDEMARIREVIEEMAPSEKAGINPEARRETPENFYWRLARIGSFDEFRLRELARIASYDNRETVIRTDDPSEAAAGGGVGAGRPSLWNKFRRAGSAKSASGQSPAYSIDPIDMIRDMALDRFRAAYHNELRDALRANAVPERAGVNMREQTVRFGDKPQRLEQIDLSPNPNWYKEEAGSFDVDEAPGRQPARGREYVWVPETMARAWYRHLLPDRASQNTILRGIRAASSAATQLILLQGGESIGHVAGLMGALMSMPNLGQGKLGKIAAWTGLGRVFPAIARIYEIDPNSKEFERDLKSGWAHGALGRNFDEFSFGDQLPILGPLKRWVFGPAGVEVRSRIAMYRMLRQYDPQMHEAEAWYIVNDRMGTYVKELAPKMVNILSGYGLDPFARPGVALGKGSFRERIGVGATAATRGWKKAFRFGTALQTTGMTVAAWALLNRIVNGEWPWHVRFGYLQVGGEEIAILPFLSNSVWRGSSLWGAREVYNSISRGADSLSEVAAAAGRGLWNASVGRAGPIIRGPLALFSGLEEGVSATPYKTSSGYMEIGSPTRTNPIGQALLNTAEVMVPQYGDYVEQERVPGIADDPFWKKTLRSGASFMGVQMRPHYSKRDQDIMEGKAETGGISGVVNGVMRETIGFEGTQRTERAILLLKKRLPKEEFVEGIGILVRRLKSSPKSSAKAAVRGAR